MEQEGIFKNNKNCVASVTVVFVEKCLLQEEMNQKTEEEDAYMSSEMTSRLPLYMIEINFQVTWRLLDDMLSPVV